MNTLERGMMASQTEGDSSIGNLPEYVKSALKPDSTNSVTKCELADRSFP